MKKVITYGTFDLLHIGHINILKRAKALGDYLIVGVTDDSYDISRGKINVSQNVVERIKAVEKTGLADEIIIEKRDGQKVNDIIKYGIDIIVLGSDWTGKIDYLKKYCDVVYLTRTNNISSTQLRCGDRVLTVGLFSDKKSVINDFNECRHIGEIDVSFVYTENTEAKDFFNNKSITIINDLDDAIKSDVDIAIVNLHNKNLISITKQILCSKKSVYLFLNEYIEDELQLESLLSIAKENNVFLTFIPYIMCNPLLQQMKSLLNSNYIGDIESITIYQKCKASSIKTYFIYYLYLLIDFSNISLNDPAVCIKQLSINDNNASIIIIKNNSSFILKIQNNNFISNSFNIYGNMGAISTKCKLNKVNYFKITTNTQKKYLSDQDIVFSKRFTFIELIKLIKNIHKGSSMKCNVDTLKSSLLILHKAIKQEV